MNILGISAFYHDSAACIIKNGEIIAAAQEERFSRKKHDSGFPVNAVNYCLQEAKITSSELDYAAFYDKPFLKFERILETYLMYAPKGLKSFLKAMPLWIKEKLWIKDKISTELGNNGEILFPEHHESHAASAFYPSPFKNAAFLTIDGVGEWTTTSYGTGNGNDLNILAELKFPHSLGLLYSAFTYYTGFRVNSGEYKVMGLAPYGEPKYKNMILKELVDLKEDGSFKLNMKYFKFCYGLTMTNSRFHSLFGASPRKPETELTRHHMDIARSLQDVTEEIVLRMARHIKKETAQKNLCLAGGVALNCVANGKLLRAGLFENIWIQPASGDAGGALGAALFTWHKYLGKARDINCNFDSQKGSYLGPCFRNDYVKKFLLNKKIPFKYLEEEELLDKCADLLNEGSVIGWFQGRMEFGPRALGNRSIIGDARSPEMQTKMNLKIKFRESFRPFAPSVLCERISDYFEQEKSSPYMLLVADVNKNIRHELPEDRDNLFGIEKLNIKRSEIPAITHVDYSARIQTVHPETNRIYYNLIKMFDDKYKCGVIVNTSFNVRGEPIVCTPEDAYVCFMRTNMDYLVLGNYFLCKKDQKPLADNENWKTEFELD